MMISGGVLKNSKARTLAMLCHTAVIPGRNFNTSAISTHGPIRKVPHAVVYDDFQCSFYCTNDGLFPRGLFTEWQNAIISTETHRVNYFDQYVSDIEIEQFDSSGKVIYAVKLIDAYPIIVSPMALSWGQKDSVSSLDVTFAYRRWNTNPIPLSPFGNNLAVNSLYPNLDIAGALDDFGIAAISRLNGQLISGAEKAGNFLGNLF